MAGFALLVAASLATPLAAQSRVRIAAQTPLLKTPEGPILGRLERGVEVPGGQRDTKAVEVTVEGWVFARSISTTTREGFTGIVNDGQGQNLRADPRPDGQLIGRLRGGALVMTLETRNGWTKVRRQAWVARLAIANPPTTAPTPATTPATTPAQTPLRDTTAPRPTPSNLGDGSRATAPRGAALAATPNGNAVGNLAPGADVRVLARAGGWTRVRLDAWVPDTALETADATATAGVTAAEVRAEPARWIGQTVTWKLQIVAVQVADGLRPELPEGRPYLLTRGPLPESGFVYVLVSPEQATRFRDAAPLSEITARVRIRAPAGRYLPNPVVEYIGEP